MKLLSLQLKLRYHKLPRKIVMYFKCKFDQHHYQYCGFKSSHQRTKFLERKATFWHKSSLHIVAEAWVQGRFDVGHFKTV